MESHENHEQEQKKAPALNGDEIPVIIKDKSKGSAAPGGQASTGTGGNGKKVEPPQGLPQGSAQQTPGGKPAQQPEEQETPASECCATDKDARISELEEQVKRLSAEFENFRRRQEKRYEESVKYAAEDVITQFLPVLDSLSQARIMTAKECNVESLNKGLELTQKQLADTLVKLGVEEIKAEGEPFDPARHHAIFVEETDEYPDDTILQEFQKGYIFKDRVIRPAMVKVSKKKS